MSRGAAVLSNELVSLRRSCRVRKDLRRWLWQWPPVNVVARYRDPPDMTMKPIEIGNELTAVTMGIDRFERRRPKTAGLLDGEGLVPIFIGDDLVSARDYADWYEINADLDKLDAAVATLPDGPRAV